MLVSGAWQNRARLKAEEAVTGREHMDYRCTAILRWFPVGGINEERGIG